MSRDAKRLWNTDQRRLLSLDEAWSIIASQARPPKCETIPLSQAYRRVLTQPLIATEDSPAFDRSIMDGFALRSADCTVEGATLRIVGLAAAGPVAPPIEVRAREAVQINTGAMIPTGADAVARIEDCTVSPDKSSVTIQVIVKPGAHVIHRGEHRKQGDEVLSAPRQMDAADIAAAAAIGRKDVTVSRGISVAIAATGDELVLPGDVPAQGQIFESNGLMLAAMINEFGGIAVNLGIVKDDELALSRTFTEALKHPIMLVAGGMSMGTLDLVPKVLASLGVRWLFHGVDMRPGKPVAFGIGPEGQQIFGLPGNPGSAFVCAHVFARMALDGLRGLSATRPTVLRATLDEVVAPARDARPAFLPADVTNGTSGALFLRRTKWGGSGDALALSQADALLFVADPSGPLDAGSEVQFIPLRAIGHPVPAVPP